MEYVTRTILYGGQPSELDWFDTLLQAQEYLKGLEGEIYKLVEVVK